MKMYYSTQFQHQFEDIQAKAEKIWYKYVEDNKERLEQEAKKDKEAFDKSVDMEFLNLWMDNL